MVQTVLRPIQQVWCKNPIAAFGQQMQPQFAKSFQFSELGSVNVYERGGYTGRRGCGDLEC